MTFDQIDQFLHTINYPQPLQLLVVDALTYEYYKRRQNIIHRDLPNVKIMKENKSTCVKRHGPPRVASTSTYVARASERTSVSNADNVL